MAQLSEKPIGKKTIIAIIIAVILAIIAITGTVIYIKNKIETEAVYLNNQTNANQAENNTSETESEQKDKKENETDKNETEATRETEEQSATTEEKTNSNTENADSEKQEVENETTTETVNEEANKEARTTTGTVTKRTGTASNTTDTTRRTDTIEETTITRTETIEIPEKQILEGHYVGWTPMDINAELASAKIKATPDDIKIEKKATTKTSENLATAGEEITYTIKVTNNSERNLSGIDVKDKIPANTTYVNNSADNNGKEVKENNAIVGIRWKIDLTAREEKEVSFKVKVNNGATGTIENVAVANGNPSEPIKTSIVSSTKTSELLRDGNEIDEPAKIGDEINYTITVTNTGNVSGKIEVKDESIDKLIKDEILKVEDNESKNIVEELKNGKMVEVKANSEATISFKATINKIDGAIKNIATVGEEKPETTIDTVNITGTKTNTDEDKKVKPGDTFDYNIVLTNSGNTAGEVKVTDEVPAALEITETNPEATVNGNNVDFGDVTVEPGTPVTLTISVKVKDTATGDIINVGQVDGKEIPDEPIKTVNITGTKTNTDADKKVKPGDTFDYSIVLTNSGNTAGTTKVTDEVPAALEITRTNPEATVNGNNVDFGDVTVEPGTPVTLTISVKVKDTATGDITNVGQVDGKEVPDEPIKTVNITGTKTNTDTDNKVKPGDTFDYNIVLTNSGNTAGAAKVTDEVPDTLEITETNPEATVEGNNVDFGDVTVEPGTPVTLTIRVKVKDTATGDITNVGQVDGKEVPDEPIKTINITGTKTNTDTDKKVKPGDTFDYNIVLTNSGNTAGEVKVTDEVPAALEITETNPEATVNGNNVDFGDVTVEPGTPVTLTISVKVKDTATGDITNVGKVDGKEVPDEPIKTVNITGTKTNTDANKKVKPGDTFDYNIVLTNSGNTAGEVKVTDEVPDALEITGTNPEATVEGNNVDFGDVTVEPETPVTLTISVKVKDTATGDITNVGKVDGKEVPDEPIKTVNITGTKTNTDADKKVKPGDTFDYNIVLTNSGNTAGEVKVTDEVPDALEITGTNPEATVEGNNVEFGDVTVEPGTPVTLTISVKVKARATGSIQNVGKVDGKDVPDEPIEIENVPKISFVKVNNDEDKKVKPGDEVVYTIKLSNDGNAEGTTTVTDQLPNGVIYKNSSDNGEHNNGNVIWRNVAVPVGRETKKLTVTVTIAETAQEKIVNTATVNNESKTDEGLDIVKITAQKDSDIPTGTYAKVNQTITYTIKAVNNGTIEGDAVVTDQIPTDKLTYVSATVDGNQNDIISENNGLITWNVKDLEPGEENARILTVMATVKDFEGLSETITNEVNVDGEKTSEETIEAGKPEITSTKTSKIISCERNELTGNKIHVGDKIEYTITVNNTGKVEKEITIQDEIKDGLEYVDGTVKANYAGTELNQVKVENGIVKLENYTLETTGTLTITFTVTVKDLPEGVNSKEIDKNVAIVDGEQITDETEYKVLKPIISTVKTSSIIECAKGLTTGNTVHENDKIKYTIKITNSGETSGKINVSDTIKDGLTYVDGSISAKIGNNATTTPTVDGNTISLTEFTLEANTTIEISFVAIVNKLPDNVYSKSIEANTVVVNNKETTDENGGYDIIKANIQSTKTSEIIECSYNQKTGKVVHENDKIRYTINVENNGTDSDIVNVTDIIPEGLTYVDNSVKVITFNNATTAEGTVIEGAVVENTQGGKQVKFEAYELKAGARIQITFEVTVNTLQDGTYEKEIENNVAVVNSKEVPDDGGFDVQKPEIEATKTVDKSKVEYGDEITYTITAKNISNVPAEVVFDDPIVSGLEYKANSIVTKINGSEAETNASYDASANKITYTGTLEEQDDTLTITFVATVKETVVGKTITNIATVNGIEKQATTSTCKKVTTSTGIVKTKPIDLILVLDTSKSMDNKLKNSNKSRIQDLKDSAKKLIKGVLSDPTTTSTVSVITYNTSVNNLGNYNYSNRQQLIENNTGKIDKLSTDGLTNIYAALEETKAEIERLGNEREKIVVFLTDGSPTIPSDVWYSGPYTDGNHDSPSTFKNNVKDKILEKADEVKNLPNVTEVYSIAIGTEDLNNKISYAELCDNGDIEKDVTINDGEFTVTLTNTLNEDVALSEVVLMFKNNKSIVISEESLSDGGHKGEVEFNRSAIWNNIVVPASGTKTLTGSFTKATNPNCEVLIDTADHLEEFDDGTPVYSEKKKYNDNGKYYHCIIQKDYAKYLLNNISSDGEWMDADSVSSAFDEILQEISVPTDSVYTSEDGSNVVIIPETETITSKVAVNIGSDKYEYTLAELETGKHGLIYKPSEGFEWTITGDLATKELSLEYTI